jgi:hypothetical protein
MRATGTKLCLMNGLLKDAKVEALCNLPSIDDMPPDKTSIVINLMGKVRKWSFQKDQRYKNIAEHYVDYILANVGPNTNIHVCADRYKDTGTSLK